jgi:hypothetical protein
MFSVNPSAYGMRRLRLVALMGETIKIAAFLDMTAGNLVEVCRRCGDTL